MLLSLLSTKQAGVKLFTSLLPSSTHPSTSVEVARDDASWAWCWELRKEKLLFHRKGPLVALAIDLIAFCYVYEFNRWVTVSHSGTDLPFGLPHEITICLVNNIACAVLKSLHRGRRRVDLAVLSLFFSLRQNELLI